MGHFGIFWDIEEFFNILNIQKLYITIIPLLSIMRLSGCNDITEEKMDRFFIVDAVKHEGETVEIKGWLYNRRGSGKIQFLIIRDGTGIIRCTSRKRISTKSCSRS